MKEDKELQKKLKSAFESPSTSFEEWAEKRGVLSNVGEKAERLVSVTADNVNGRGMPVGSKKKALSVVISVIVLFLAVIIILFSVLPRSKLPKLYGENDTVITDIELSEIEKAYLFDMSDVVSVEAITKHTLKSDNAQILLYALHNCLLSIENSDGYDGFYITYRIRTYQYYNFFGSPKYEKFNNSIDVLNLKIDYSIDESSDPMGFAKFSVGNYEYFIEAFGYPGLTVLNEDNFTNLLNKILI